MASILHVIHSARSESGGPIEGVRQRGRVLTEMGHRVEVASLDVHAPEGVGLKVHALGEQEGGYGKSKKLLNWLQDHSHTYDHVVVNGIWQFHGYAVWKTLAPKGKPYFVFPHGMLDPWFKTAYPLKHLKKSLYWRLIESKVLRDAKAVLFTSEEERLLAAQSFKPYRVREKVVRYGTAAPEGNSLDQEVAFRGTNPRIGDRPYILFLSRIHPKKGADLLLHAFAEVAQSAPHLQLIMAGPDQVGQQSSLQQLARSLGIDDRIHWPGMLTGDLKWGAYFGCDAFILPSHQENFGIVLAEAMACSKPVLTTRKVNIWREIESSGAGIVREDTQQGVTDTLRTWLSLTEDQRKVMASAAKRCFDDHFEIHGAARSLLEVMTEANVKRTHP